MRNIHFIDIFIIQETYFCFGNSETKMCIASIVKLPNCDVFTFSRDENTRRAFAQPSFIKPGIFAPKDLEAGGTWIGTNRKSVMSLQNGGKNPHKRELPYELSRGQILLNLLEFNNLENIRQLINNHKTEPFTISIHRTGQLEKELITWDGQQLEVEIIPHQNKWLNCSSTLYNDALKERFVSDLKNAIFYTPEEVCDFHLQRIIGSELNPLTQPGTSSITQFVLNGEYCSCRFIDLLEKTDNTYSI